MRLSQSLIEKAKLKHDFFAIYCGVCGNVKKIPIRCKDRTCPVCSIARSERILAGYYSSIASKKNLRLLTLTLKESPLSIARFNHLRNSFKELRKIPYYRQALLGGIYGIEVKKRNIGENWYIHMHILFEGMYIPQETLSKDWLSITGDSFIVDIRKMREGDGKKGLRYLTKYMTKPPEAGSYTDLYNSVLKGKQLLHTFGSWRRLTRQPTQYLPCQMCGANQWITEFEMVRLSQLPGEGVLSPVPACRSPVIASLGASSNFPWGENYTE